MMTVADRLRTERYEDHQDCSFKHFYFSCNNVIDIGIINGLHFNLLFYSLKIIIKFLLLKYTTNEIHKKVAKYKVIKY